MNARRRHVLMALAILLVCITVVMTVAMLMAAPSNGDATQGEAARSQSAQRESNAQERTAQAAKPADEAAGDAADADEDPSAELVQESDETAADEVTGDGAGETASSQSAFQIPEGVTYEPEVVLVSVDTDADPREVEAMLQRSGAVQERPVTQEEIDRGLIELSVKPGVSVEDAVNALLEEDETCEAQPNYTYYLMMGDESDLRQRLAAEAEAVPEAAEQPAPQTQNTDAAATDDAQTGEGEDANSDDAPADASTEESPTNPAEAQADVSESEEGEDSDPEESADAELTIAGQEGDELEGVETLAEALSVNDPYVSRQWALTSLQAFEAWSLATCDHAAGIAIIDTAASTDHVDLAANVVATYDACTRSTELPTAVNHGTHVAGIASAVANNEAGIAGISHNAELVLINIFDSEGKTYTNDIVAAYDYIERLSDERNLRVVNISFGKEVSSPDFADNKVIIAMTTAYEEYGIISVASAGNAEQGTIPYYEFPGDAEHVVSVMNLQRNGDGVTRNTGSNYNVEGQRAKTISAPGSSIYSTYPENKYAYLGGTSMAAPHVAGILALEFAANPDLTADEAVQALYATATDLGLEGFDETYGWGAANAYAAVQAAKTGEFERVDLTKVNPVPEPDPVEVPMPSASGATRIPVGATATYTVKDGSLAIQSGWCATLEGNTLRGDEPGYMVLSVLDANGEERSTIKVEVYRVSGYYRVRSALDMDYVMAVDSTSLANGGNVGLQAAKGKTARWQTWKLEIQSDNSYRLLCARTGKALHIQSASKESGANALQFRANSSKAQRWRMVVDASNRVQLINVHSGKALAVMGGSARDGANVRQVGAGVSLAQKWDLRATAPDVGVVWEGIYKVSSHLDKGYVLAVSGGSRANGAAVTLAKDTGALWQRWRFDYLGNGFYRITNVRSGRVLGLASESTQLGNPCQQQTWANRGYQKWILRKMSNGSFTLIRSDESLMAGVRNNRAAAGQTVGQYSYATVSGRRWWLTQY